MWKILAAIAAAGALLGAATQTSVEADKSCGPPETYEPLPETIEIELPETLELCRDNDE